MMITAPVIHTHEHMHCTSTSAKCTHELNGFQSSLGRKISPETQPIRQKVMMKITLRPWASLVQAPGQCLVSRARPCFSLIAPEGRASLHPFYRWNPRY